MNEQKHNKMMYLHQTNNTLQNDWDELRAHLHSLAHLAIANSKPDMATPIIRKIYVLQSNRPSKKIYRAILKFYTDITDQFYKMGLIRSR